MLGNEFAGSLEAIWYRDNIEEINKLYWGKWIAIRGKRIIDADLDDKKLTDRVGFSNALFFCVIHKEIKVDTKSWWAEYPWKRKW